MTKKKFNYLIIHIGLHKTASTSLQDLLFHKLDKNEHLNFVGKCSFASNHENDIIKNSISYFLGISNILPKFIFNKDRINLYSDEGLTNSFYISSYNVGAKLNAHQIAAKLNSTFSSIFRIVKPVVVLRSQKTIIPSRYIESYSLFIKDKQTRTPDKFIPFVLNNKELFETWYYDELLDTYAKIFGEQNLEVLLYEDLIHNSDEYYFRWSKILGVDQNFIKKTLTEKILNQKKQVKNGKVAERVPTKIARILLTLKKNTRFYKIIDRNRKKWDNSLFKKILLRKLVKSQVIRNFTEKEKEIIFTHFQESNKNLIGRFGLNADKLKRYGYI